ncbi:hypothetical protein BDF22DRAFT_750772 [Syncephalis plumigaleata]|nr:hypothetical protein BDF22DRAFT_750772 [Syncephalis plumigaleata]
MVRTEDPASTWVGHFCQTALVGQLLFSAKFICMRFAKNVLTTLPVCKFSRPETQNWVRGGGFGPSGTGVQQVARALFGPSANFLGRKRNTERVVAVFVPRYRVSTYPVPQHKTAAALLAIIFEDASRIECVAAVFVREVPGSYPVSRKPALSVGYNFKCFRWRGGELGSQNRFFKNGTHQPLKSSLPARNKNHHHALDYAFLAKKTRRRAKQSIGYLLETSKTLIKTGLAVLSCRVAVSYPVPDGPKPPPRTQFCVSSRENLQAGQTEHWLPAGSLKAVLQSVDAVMSCRVAVSYPVPDGPKPPPRTQCCVSRRENLQTGQTEHWLPADAFKNNGQKCCGCLALRYRSTGYLLTPSKITARSAAAVLR